MDTSQPMADPRLAELVASLVEEVSLEAIVSSHREAKLGLWALLVPQTSEDQLIEDPSLDIFGQPSGALGGGGGRSVGGRSGGERALECVCPQCGRTLAAARFAPHLEKCMGMGRKAGRQATRRLAAAAAALPASLPSPSPPLDSEPEGLGGEDFNPAAFDDDDDDDEWTSGRGKRRGKRKGGAKKAVGVRGGRLQRPSPAPSLPPTLPGTFEEDSDDFSLLSLKAETSQDAFEGFGPRDAKDPAQDLFSSLAAHPP